MEIPVAIIPASGWSVNTARTFDHRTTDGLYPVVAFAVYEIDDAPHLGAIRPIIADADRARWLILDVDNTRIVRNDTGTRVNGCATWGGYKRIKANAPSQSGHQSD